MARPELSGAALGSPPGACGFGVVTQQILAHVSPSKRRAPGCSGRLDDTTVTEGS